MSLIAHAERELNESGLMSEGSDYDGMVGEAVLELITVFAKQGHSGNSAYATVDLFRRLATYQILVPLKNPMQTGEYLDHSDISGGHPTFQSTRKSSVFSEDGGKTWYDIDKYIPRWKRWFGVKRVYIKF